MANTVVKLIDDGAKLEVGGIGFDDELFVGIRIVEEHFFRHDSLDLLKGLLTLVGPRKHSLLRELGEGG